MNRPDPDPFPSPFPDGDHVPLHAPPPVGYRAVYIVWANRPWEPQDVSWTFDLNEALAVVRGTIALWRGSALASPLMVPDDLDDAGTTAYVETYLSQPIPSPSPGAA